MPNQPTQIQSPDTSTVLFINQEKLKEQTRTRRRNLLNPSVNKPFHDLIGAEDGLEYRANFDFDGMSRIAYIGEELNSRRGIHAAHAECESELDRDMRDREHVSANFVSQSSMVRFFRLMKEGRAELSGKLTSTDFITILNTNDNPIWNYLPGDGFYDDGFPAALSAKLTKLTALQKTALIEVCEILWRTEYNDTLESILNILGIELREEADKSN
ncbi:hypothetical protein [Acidovorax sp. ST3]|uniref:hypothetical protein n=1 Tax=Acidovorax sp. ST3 TaxID=2219062 RepID=UPI00128FD465|nr:hypothetical protein [Acidovorax sp. ST3]